MSRTSSWITCSGLGFAWPDGDVVFDGLDLVIGSGRTGLVGVNGSGKSTLLRLIARELTPNKGSISVAGEFGYLPQNLPQNLPLAASLRVDDVLGVAEKRRALAAIERGEAGEAEFAVVGDDWDVEERTDATLAQLGLGDLTPDRRVGELSGGESVLLGLAALLLRRPDVLLLDEPTNNLDLDARHRLYDAVEAWNGVLVMVSHDRELLGLVDRVGDLRAGSVRWYGGDFEDYEAVVEAEQGAAQRMVRAAEGDVRRQRRELIEARTKLDRRVRYGNKMWEQKREPKAVMAERKRQAQVSAGKHLNTHLDKLDEARGQLAEAEEAVREDAEIRIDLPDTAVPSGRRVLTLRDARLRYGGKVSLAVQGPERIALIGANGAGKTTLLRTVSGSLEPVDGVVETPVPVRYLPQRLDVLDDGLTIVENVARFAPTATPNAIRAKLARFLFRGTRADQPAGTLSGGERFRATLAALLLAEPAPQLLMLDEPTNNLDLASVAQLTRALAAYRGALLVASHDLPFLREIGVTRWVRLDGELTEVDAL